MKARSLRIGALGALGALAIVACVASAGLACAKPDVPPPLAVSLGRAGELGRLAFEVQSKHRYYFALRLHFDPADHAARVRLRELIDGTRPTAAGPTDLKVHLLLRRVDSPGSEPIFDADVEALPQGFGADWFERTISSGFLLEPGRYESVVTLREPRPAFDPYPATLTLSSDKGRVDYDR